MVKHNSRSLQTGIITKMDELCHLQLPDPLPIEVAAYRVSNMPSLYKVSQSCCKRWYTHWLQFDMLPCYTPSDFTKRVSVAWNVASLAELKRIVDICPVLYLDEIARKLKTNLNLRFSAPSISKALRRHLHYSRKVVYDKASQQIAKDKDDFISTMKHYLQTPDMAIFIDESNKDRKAARRKYGWSPVGSPVNYRLLFNRDIRYTLIGAADCFGFVVHACDVVLHQYKEKEEQKPVDAERFVQFVRAGARKF